MLGNAFQVTWVKIHFLIVMSFHILQVLYSTAKAILVALYSTEGKGTAQPTVNLLVTTC